MWLYMIYCVGALNACQGTYYTESSPMISTRFKDQAECTEQAIRAAKGMKAEKPQHRIMWRCIDYSNVEVEEDKR